MGENDPELTENAVNRRDAVAEERIDQETDSRPSNKESAILTATVYAHRREDYGPGAG